jgi:hypothetical protein
VGGGSWRALYFHDDARELRQAVVGLYRFNPVHP